MMSLTLVVIGCTLLTLATAEGPLAEEDWGNGLKVKIIDRPDDCDDGARAGDLIHYHYVGRLFDTGEEFGKRFVSQICRKFCARYCVFELWCFTLVTCHVRQLLRLC